MKLITAQNASNMTQVVMDIQCNVELSELQGPVSKAGGLLVEIMESVISSINKGEHCCSIVFERTPLHLYCIYVYLSNIGYEINLQLPDERLLIGMTTLTLKW